jgi:hypothetical protein
MAFATGGGVATMSSLQDTDFRKLVLQAMDAKDGKATADVTGKVADLIRQKINRPDARVVAEVTTVVELKQEGCKQFKIRYTTPGTLLPTADGSSRELDMSMMLNMCRNGQPPAAN